MFQTARVEQMPDFKIINSNFVIGSEADRPLCVVTFWTANTHLKYF